MQTISLKQLIAKGGVSAISILRTNESGYPFLTFLLNGKAQNVYLAKGVDAATGFGATMSKVIADTGNTPEIVMGYLASVDAVLCCSVKPNGDIRYKISRAADTNYSSATLLSRAFGLELAEVMVDFDLDAFKGLYQAKGATTNANPNLAQNTAEEDLDAQIVALEAELAKTQSATKKAKLQAQIDALLA